MCGLKKCMKVCVILFKNLKVLLKLSYQMAPECEVTPSVPFFLSSISFWDVPKYYPISKNKSH